MQLHRYAIFKFMEGVVSLPRVELQIITVWQFTKIPLDSGENNSWEGVQRSGYTVIIRYDISIVSVWLYLAARYVKNRVNIRSTKRKTFIDT